MSNKPVTSIPPIAEAHFKEFAERLKHLPPLQPGYVRLYRIQRLDEESFNKKLGKMVRLLLQHDVISDQEHLDGIKKNLNKRGADYCSTLSEIFPYMYNDYPTPSAVVCIDIPREEAKHGYIGLGGGPLDGEHEFAIPFNETLKKHIITVIKPEELELLAPLKYKYERNFKDNLEELDRQFNPNSADFLKECRTMRLEKLKKEKPKNIEKKNFLDKLLFGKEEIQELQELSPLERIMSARSDPGRHDR